MEIFEVNKHQLSANYNFISDTVKADRIFYAMKANGSNEVIKCLSEIDANFEISSEGELEKLINANVKSENIISSIPVKTVNFIKSAYKYGVRYFTFDCLEELEKINKYAKHAKKILRIYIHDIDPESYTWGITLDKLLEIKKNNLSYFNMIDGITLHISRNYQIKLIEPIFSRIEKVLSILNNDKKLIVNIGGGYFSKLPPYLEYKYNLETYYCELNERLEIIRSKFNIEIYCEPGKGIVDTACNLILPIQQLTVRNGKNCIFVNFNAYQVGTLPIKIERIRNGEVEVIYDADWVLDRKVKRKKYIYSIIDTLCEWSELMKITSCKELEYEDILKLYGVGAYSIALSSDFHSRKRIETKIIQ